MPGVGFPRSPQDTRKTQDTPIPAVLGKTLTDYLRLVWRHWSWEGNNSLDGRRKWFARDFRRRPFGA